ncbi:MAG: hypothetical protein OMM_06632 [Candidatus Magnetoglobus multicellularis str. Araruama]|uniref:Caspase family p20 domain-containing protein n=1 Tax=Candidatus Magnetoglobus multicellularis str. Araruama TaxID=890399 RepID=A0A1V1PGR5_9BACT|nr:MAG: hypothetical protein OMM_06632 [Candidatus Magnetoglobus multicellularis str. Araruama]
MISRATPLFGNKIVSTLLMDKDVTYDHIKKGFIHLSKNMKPYDVFVLFIAGHGIDLDGNYYFIPYNLNNDGLKETLKNKVFLIINYIPCYQW